MKLRGDPYHAILYKPQIVYISYTRYVIYNTKRCRGNYGLQFDYPELALIPNI
jgi:hypothetical protein